jgi:hypothetical protein
MANYNLNKTVYNRRNYEEVIDTSFSQVTPNIPVEDTITVEQFFNYYNTLFYDIPVEGEINSHAYIVKRSGDYINASVVNEDVQLLLDEITSLRQDLLNANQTVLNLQISSSTQTTV